MKINFYGLLASLVAFSGHAVVAADKPIQKQFYSMTDFRTIRKFDAHVHANSANPAFISLASKDNFELLSINVDYPDFPPIDRQYALARAFQKAAPDRFHFAATFSMSGWGNPDWSQKTSASLAEAVKGGAVAIKVWKNIGMSFRGADGKLVMIDNPGFDVVMADLEMLGVPLIGHMGEPHNCWLSLDAMTTDNDRSYFKAHPQYHMYLHPELPSYDEQMAARDRLLDRHPTLRFVGAHMASLEWSVDRLKLFLDHYPNANVDLAARMTQVQYQSHAEREKVRQFFIIYADRLLYGSDITMEADAKPVDFIKEAHQQWRSDWAYLATGKTQYIPALKHNIKGLSLPRAVIDKIYWNNAQKEFFKQPMQSLR